MHGEVLTSKFEVEQGDQKCAHSKTLRSDSTRDDVRIKSCDFVAHTILGLGQGLDFQHV